MKRLFAFTLCAAALACLGYAYAEGEGEEAKAPPADPVKEAVTHIDAGKAALLEGNTEAALDHLQRAIGLIQAGMQKRLEAFMPAAPAGFLKGEVNTNSGSWGSGEQAVQITTVSCDYTREGEDESGMTVGVEFSNSPQIYESMKAMVEMYDSPEFRAAMAANPDMTLEKVEGGGFTGWLTVNKGESAQIVAIAKGLLVQINVSTDDAAVAKTFWAALDHKGLASAVSGK